MGIFDTYKEVFSAQKPKGRIEEENKPSLKPEKRIASRITKKEPPTRVKEITERVKNKSSTFPIFPKLYWMIKKDIKLILRSKTSALIVLLGPLLIILLVALAFNTSSLYNIKIAAYSESYSPLTESVLTDLQDQQYQIIKLDSKTKCIEGIKSAQYHICAVFPKDMSLDNIADNILVYVDESRVNLASLISGTISMKIANKSSALSLDLTTTLISTLENTKGELTNKEKTLQGIEVANLDSNTKLTNLKESLSEIDLLNESKMNFSEIIKGVRDFRADCDSKDESGGNKYNCPSDTRLRNVEKNIESLKETLEDTQLTLRTSTAEVSDIKTKIAESTEQIKATKTSLTQLKTDIESIKITNAEAIVSPIKTTIEPITSKKTHLGILFPTLTILIMMFISILLASTLVIREKTSLAYFRNFITPTNDLLFMVGAFLTNIILLIIQLIILFGGAIPFFTKDLVPALLPLVVSLIVISTVFILIGTLIGYLFNSEETSTLGAIAVAALMLLFSNTILPLETLPQYIRDIVQYNPFVMGEGMLKQIIMFQATLGDLWVKLVILLGASAVLAILALVARKATKRRIA
ncbi:MAG: ABC transporter permease [Candidatus Nanoarchaeia archaeon]|nr:ABC transporter permease [Candidatus Nanoarchaeia archaeon]